MTNPPGRNVGQKDTLRAAREVLLATMTAIAKGGGPLASLMREKLTLSNRCAEDETNPTEKSRLLRALVVAWESLAALLEGEDTPAVIRATVRGDLLMAERVLREGRYLELFDEVRALFQTGESHNPNRKENHNG